MISIDQKNSSVKNSSVLLCTHRPDLSKSKFQQKILRDAISSLENDIQEIKSSIDKSSDERIQLMCKFYTQHSSEGVIKITFEYIDTLDEINDEKIRIYEQLRILRIITSEILYKLNIIKSILISKNYLFKDKCALVYLFALMGYINFNTKINNKNKFIKFLKSLNIHVDNLIKYSSYFSIELYNQVFINLSEKIRTQNDYEKEDEEKYNLKTQRYQFEYNYRILYFLHHLKVLTEIFLKSIKKTESLISFLNLNKLSFEELKSEFVQYSLRILYLPFSIDHDPLIDFKLTIDNKGGLNKNFDYLYLNINSKKSLLSIISFEIKPIKGNDDSFMNFYKLYHNIDIINTIIILSKKNNKFNSYIKTIVDKFNHCYEQYKDEKIEYEKINKDCYNNKIYKYLDMKLKTLYKILND